MSKGFRVFCFQLKQELVQVRVRILFMILAVFIYSYLEPVANLAQAVGEKVSPWAFPHLMNDYICQMVFMVSAVFLFSTAPFEGKAHYYIVQRSGSFSWQLGNVLYILASSFLFVGFIWAFSVISLLSRTRFIGDWGIIWGTLARTNAGNQYDVPFTVFAYIVGAFSPVEATAISFLLEWTCVSWMGLVVYLFNYITKKMTGILVASLFVFLDVMIYNSWTPKAYLFSPVTLAQLKVMSGNNLSYGVSLKYAVVFFAVTIMFFIAICLGQGTKKAKKRGLKNE